jgi:glutamate-ammonia-ligase adenylyltransferase
MTSAGCAHGPDVGTPTDSRSLRASVAAARETNPLSLEHALRAVCQAVDAARRALAERSRAGLPGVWLELAMLARFFACEVFELLHQRGPVRGGFVVFGQVAEDEGDSRLSLELLAVTDSIEAQEHDKLARILDKLRSAGTRLDPPIEVHPALGSIVVSLGRPEAALAAWSTPDRLAMSSARFLWGPSELAEGFALLSQSFVLPSMLPATTLHDLYAMRRAIEETRAAQGSPCAEACVLELELLARTLRVLHGARCPQLLRRGVTATLDAATEVGLCAASDELAASYALFREVAHEGARDRLLSGRQRADATDTRRRDELVARERSLRDTLTCYLPAAKSPAPARVRRSAAGSQGRAPRGPSPATPLGSELAAIRPTLERLLRRCAAPEDVALRLHDFAQRYGAEATLYETLHRFPRTLELLVRIFDHSRFFSDLLLTHVGLFDDLQDAGSWRRKSVAAHLAELRAGDDVPPDRCRRHRNAELFRIFTRDVAGLASPEETAVDYTALAEACVRFAVESVAAGEPIAVVALGKFGGGELSYGSDLDCVFVGGTAGPVQQVIQFLTEVRPTGSLFPVDLRLRPDGSKGEVTLGLRGYHDYYRGRAQP